MIEQRSWRLRQLSATEATSEVALIIGDAPADLAAFTAQLTGPHCAYAKTLPASFPFTLVRPWEAEGRRGATFRAVVTETCLWEPEHPFLYDFEFSWGTEEAVRLPMGFRKLARVTKSIHLHGQACFLRGIGYRPEIATELETLRRLGVQLLLGTPPGVWQGCDRHGPWVAAMLPESLDDALLTIVNAGPLHPSIGFWVLPKPWPEVALTTLRKQDPTVLYFERVDASAALPAVLADGVILEGAADAILAASHQLSVPWLALCSSGLQDPIKTPETWQALRSRFDSLFVGRAGCAGWIVDGTTEFGH